MKKTAIKLALVGTFVATAMSFGTNCLAMGSSEPVTVNVETSYSSEKNSMNDIKNKIVEKGKEISTLLDNLSNLSNIANAKIIGIINNPFSQTHAEYASAYAGLEALVQKIAEINNRIITIKTDVQNLDKQFMEQLAKLAKLAK